MIVFSATLAKRLSAERLPPTYVGVRRVRPSSRLVAKALGKPGDKEEEEVANEQPLVFRIVDPETGTERRMTKREKKDCRFQQKQEDKKKRKLEAKQEAEQQASKKAKIESEDERIVDGQKSVLAGDRFVNLEIDPAALEEELADLRGDRDGVPPVMLPPSMSRLAIKNKVVQGSCVLEPLSVIVDDDLAAQWAVELKDSMKAAEQVRISEDLRPMPYHIVPLAWTRMRPAEIGQKEFNTEVSSTQETAKEESLDAWAFCNIRQSAPYSDEAAVIQLLYEGTELHISCGAKFGCDYLVYDGPRNERHAFAGLRVLSSSNGTLPLPTAYNLAGYVRCLNTAGKLALLATVVQEKDDGGGIKHRVAIIDLALEKTAMTTSRRPKKTIERRVQTLTKT